MAADLLTVLVWNVASEAVFSIADLLETAVGLGVGLPRFAVIPAPDELSAPMGDPDVVVLIADTLGEFARLQVIEARRRLPRTPIVVIAEEGTVTQAERLTEVGVVSSLLRRELGGSLLARVLVGAIEPRQTASVTPARSCPRSRSDDKGPTVSDVNAIEARLDSLATDVLREFPLVKDACLQTVLEALPDPVAFVDLEGIVRMCNRYTAGLYGRDHPEELIGHNAFRLIAPEDRALAHQNFKRLLAGERVKTVPYRAVKCDGTNIFVEIRAKVVRDLEGKPMGFLGSIRDVTELRRVEEALAWSRADYRRLVENTSDLVCEIDEAGCFVYLNPQYEAALGYNPESLVGTDSKALIHPDDLVAAQRKHAHLLEDEGRSIDEWRFKHSDGTWRWMECTGKVYRTPSGEVRTVVISRDVTDRKRTDRALRSALRDKTALLQEVHHRVKNNLAVVVSLLGLQAMAIDDPKARDALWESRRRIEAMARVHEHLYRAPEVSRVDMAAYVTALCRDVRCSMGLPDLELRLDLASLHLEIGRAIPCALVLNELMTNALKHGFLDRHAPLELTSSPSEARSMIGISLQRSNGAVELVVSNNGRPLPPDFDLTACESLGLSLVKLLTEQLEGELSVSDDVGVAFRLKFPLPSEDQGDGEP